MAKSKAQKLRAHAVRNGKRNPELNRGVTPAISTHERKTPTRKELLHKQYKKESLALRYY